MRTVTVYRRLLSLCDRNLDRTHKILEFGCGSGKVVHAFRAAGFDAYGFDLHDALERSSTADRDFFRSLKTGEDTSTFQTDWVQYRLPYDDETFDFVFSEEVMEHVLNHDAVLKEIARVLKPDGLAFHTFPSKYRLIEPHMLVPFGSFFKGRWYYLPWALLGIRNPSQKGLTVGQTASSNSTYAQMGLNYRRLSTLLAIGGKYFRKSTFAPELWQIAWGTTRGAKLSHCSLRFFTRFVKVTWLLEGPRRDQTFIDPNSDSMSSGVFR